MYKKFSKLKDLNQFIQLNDQEVVNVLSGIILKYERISKSKLTAGLDEESIFYIDYASSLRKKLTEAEFYKIYKVFQKQSRSLANDTSEDNE